jgi:hypothetical protein
MGKFGWSLPPGVSHRDIDRAFGGDAPENCLVCKEPLDEDNVTDTCPTSKDCAAKLEQLQKEEAEAEKKLLEEHPNDE